MLTNSIQYIYIQTQFSYTFIFIYDQNFDLFWICNGSLESHRIDLLNCYGQAYDTTAWDEFRSATEAEM